MACGLAGGVGDNDSRDKVMGQNETDFTPVMREYRGSYLHLNIDQLGINLASA